MVRKFLSLIFMVGLLIVFVLSACSGENVESDADTEDAAENDVGEGTKKDGEKYKIGILAPAVTHGWVAAVAYHAENRVKELSDEIEYQIQTSSDASEMTSQLDDLMTGSRSNCSISSMGRNGDVDSNSAR